MNLKRDLLTRLKSSKFLFAASILIGLISGIFVLWQASILSKIINQVFIEKMNLNAVMPLMLLLLVIILLRSISAYFNETIPTQLAVQIKKSFRGEVLKKIDQLGPVFIKSKQSSDLITSALQGVEKLHDYYSLYLPQLILAAVVPFVFLIVVFPLDFLSGLVLFLTAPLIPFFMILIGQNAEKLTRKQWSALTRLSAHFYDTLKGLSTLKALNRSKEYETVISDVNQRYLRTTMNVLRLTFLSALVLELVSTISTAIVAVQIGLRLLHGGILFEQAFFILLLAPEFYLPIRSLGTRFHAGMSGVSASKDIFNILDQKITHPEHAIESKSKISKDELSEAFQSNFKIEFTNISFKYPQRSEVTLDTINLTLRANTLTALVGDSGAGKSTLADLLLGFQHPSSGRIKLNQISLEDIPSRDLWQYISWVPQQPYLFQGSILENIKLGQQNASQESILQAAQMANLGEFIQNLPKQYETKIGENAFLVSSGQAKRIALARAYLKDAPILIMDEPTAHLDPRQEVLLREAVDKICQNKTVLMIAHRISTIQNADQIIFLKKGKIVEIGQHTALLNQKGLYSQFVKNYLGER